MKNQTVGMGTAFVAIAVLFGLGGLQYPLGSVDQPGPGFFPVAVSVCLCVLGIIMITKGLAEATAAVDYRFKNIAIISAALLGFAAVTDYINMIAGIVVLVAISSFSATSYSITRVVKIVTGLVIIAFAFKYLLGLNLPL